MSQRWDSKFELKPGKWVYVPNADTIERGREIKRHIEDRWKSPSYFFHLRRGGHVSAMKSHLGQNSFVHLDIRDFFGSVSRTRVTRCLKGMFSYDEAREIANFSTIVLSKDGKREFSLPFGFVQSTLLASICLHKSALGACLKRLAGVEGVRVSVYVDDIVVSSTHPDVSEAAMAELKSAAARSGFILNEEKEQGPAASVSAFNIALSKYDLAVTTARWRQFLDALRMATTESQSEGILGYVGSVNPAQAKSLLVSI
ncbi:hypothetical protein PCA20602_05105 [Pandoraea capi]|uniref:Reverse transcriptase domain-containing protein n=2 Tax=Pandoraea capi TaxID=2508286 RepID=A0ABY6WCG1_9BURK|nr:hypothetical protein PCA20602_05105 [Pandoraea capi]